MVSMIKDVRKSWTVRIIFIVVLLVFTLFGVYGYFGNNLDDNSELARVGREIITIQDFDQSWRNQSDNNQTSPRQLLDYLINSKLLNIYNNKIGNFVADEAVARQIIVDRNFYTDNRFDKRKYDEFLRQSNLSSTQYEKRLADQLQLTTLENFIINLSEVDYNFALEQYEAFNRVINYKFASISATNYLNKVEVSDEYLQEYYSNNLVNYTNKQAFKLDYFIIKDVDLINKDEIDENSLQSYYQQNIENYKIKAGYHTHHILLSLDDEEGKSEVEILNEAFKLRDEIIQDPEIFSEYAFEYSDDPSAQFNNGDVGYVEVGGFDADYEQAALDLDVGEISLPVKTRFGYHIIKLISKSEESTPTFNEVRDNITLDYQKEFGKIELANVNRDLGNSISNEEFNSLIEVYTTNGKTLSTTFNGEISHLIEQNEAFYEKLKTEEVGENSSWLQSNLIIYKINEIIPERVNEFNKVKSQVENNYKIDRALTLLNEDVSQFQNNQIVNIDNFQQYINENGIEFTNQSINAFDQIIPQVGQHQELYRVILNLSDENKYDIVAQSEENKSYYLIEFISSIQNTPATKEVIESVQNQITNVFQNYYFNAIITNLREETKININNRLLERYISSIDSNN